MERAAAGFTFADGPVWSREGFLLVSDPPTNRILKWIPGQPLSVYRDSANGPAGNALDSQGRLYTCETLSRRLVRSDKKGRVEILAERYQGKRLNAPNDVVVRKDGEIYFTDPAFGNQQDTRELDFYGIYHITRKGVLEVIAKPNGRPNGIALSPNGKILYVSISDSRSVLAFDLDKSGDASGERVLISKTDGPPNGIRVDEKGNLYVATKGMSVFTADGTPIRSIPFTDPPSNFAFGDADFGTLYITSRGFVLRVRLDVKGAVQY